MNQVLLQKAIKLNKERKRKKRWQNAVRFLAAGVVFCTTYALILPAITMNQDPACGFEAHEHGAECYAQQAAAVTQCDAASHVHSDECKDQMGNLVCGYGEQVIHSHDEFCYDASGALVCALPEIGQHIHTEECYAQSSQLACTIPEGESHVHGEECLQSTSTLVCQQTEEEPHAHAEQCYEMVSELACELPEDENHNHEDGCYRMVSQLFCQVPEGQTHTHEESCYHSETAVVCTLEETEGHVHTEECWQQVQGLVCQIPQIAEHTHSEACVDENGNRACGIVQAVVHEHNEQCFAPAEETQEVLACELEEHIHEDSCYPLEEPTEETGNPWLCNSGAHTHAEGCYDEENNLVCSIPEHTHEAGCLVADLDMTADVETREQWEAELNKLAYTGIWSEDVLTIAESQLGYQESRRNVILDENGVLRGYTRFGEWYGDHYGDWCAMFVSFCLDYAGVKDFPQEASCTLWIELLTEQERYQLAAGYTPKPGDVIFFDWQQPSEGAVEADHVGLVVELIPATEETPAQIRTIEGNSTEQVEYNTYNMDDPTIIGYGVLPEQIFFCGQTPHYHVESCYDAAGAALCGQEAHVHNENCWDLSKNYEVNGRTLECEEEHEHTADCYGDAVAHFTYSDDMVSMKVTVVSSEGIPAGTQMEVTGLSDDNYHTYADYAEANSVGELTGLTGYQFRFLLAGEEIELEGAEITVELTMNSSMNASEEVSIFSLTGSGMDADESLGTAFGIGLNLFSAANSETEPEETEPAEDQFAGNGTTSTIKVLSQDAGNVITQQTLELGDEVQTATVILGDGNSIALMSEAAASFTVEYYAHFPMFQYSTTVPSGTYLEIIDTRGDGDASDGDYGSLPYNAGSTTQTGTDRGILYLRLQDTGRKNTDRVSSALSGNSNASLNTYGTAIYEVMTVDTLTQVYRDESYTYSAGMDIMNVDSLHENSHYELSEMWVSTDDGATWTVYTEKDGNVTADGFTISKTVKVDDLHNVKFTNNSANTSDVLIGDQDTVRMVYNLVEGTQYVSANLFDYDITDTNVYARNSSGNVVASYGRANDTIWYVNNYSNDNGKIYMQTVDANGNNLGINSPGSYVNASSGNAYLAFGNANTGVTYQTAKRAGAYINQANRANSNSVGGFKYCHFGLVTDYDILTDTLTYANGVNYQALFNDEAYYSSQNPGYSVDGKTPYYRQRLEFTRTGDTYVLSALNSGDALGNGVTASNLDEFNYTASTARSDLLSNNFWPMDGTSGDLLYNKDMEFGTVSDYNNSFRNWYNADDGGSAKLPQSDDGLSHNSYFGMQYSVEFTMDGKYCGPLEYLFYGDDDMWVFLTDIDTGETQLICDIGGVHSSVGSFTDLWDYIPKDSTSTYRLTFFYTERGASGSSCYMEFTLPQVTSITQNTPDTGSVSVTKNVDGLAAPTDESFAFLFELSGNVDGLNDSFGYEIVDSGNVTVDAGTIVRGSPFYLKEDQTITIVGIPEGANYTITEQLTDVQEEYYDISWTGTSNAAGNAVSGTISGNTAHSYDCINTAVGSLSVTKLMGDGTNPNIEFVFDITLHTPDGTPISGTFSDVEFVDGKAQVSLKPNQTVVLQGLPVGAVWTVLEQANEKFDVRYQVDGSSSDAPSGTITHNHTAAVSAINSAVYSLPETGSGGTKTLYTFGGLSLLATALMYYCIFGHRRRKGGG